MVNFQHYLEKQRKIFSRRQNIIDRIIRNRDTPISYEYSTSELEDFHPTLKRSGIFPEPIEDEVYQKLLRTRKFLGPLISKGSGLDKDINKILSRKMESIRYKFLQRVNDLDIYFTRKSKKNNRLMEPAYYSFTH